MAYNFDKHHRRSVRRFALLITGVIFFLHLPWAYGGPFDIKPRLPAKSTSSPPRVEGRLEKFQLLNTVFAYIGRHYVGFDELEPQGLLENALAGVEKVVPNLEAVVSSSRVKVEIGSEEGSFDITGIESWGDLREKLKDILSFIESGGRCTTGFEGLEYAALNGILGSLDPYSRLYRPRDFERISSLGSSSFVGLGLEVEFKDGFLTVVQLYENSPAYRAGVRQGDKIVEIDGESTRNMTLAEALSRLNGPPDSGVTISVTRDGGFKSFALARERIHVEGVEWELLTGSIGYLRIKNFQEGTFRSVVKKLEDMKKATEIRGLIIDFRGNYGGVMEEILKVADLFLSEGILTIKTSAGQRLPSFVRATASGNREEGWPTVVIMDEGSASGAEIVASALKENNRALLIGEQSFGKACIQQLFALKGRYVLKLTTARYFTPLGCYIQYAGLTPDILLVPIRTGSESTLGVESIGEGGSSAPSLRAGGRAGTSLARRAHYQNEGLTREKIERPAGKEAPRVTLFYIEDDVRLRQSEDYQVELARRLLEAGLPPAREGMWEICDKVVKASQKEQDKKIVKELERMGIDWSTGPAEGRPLPVSGLSLDRGLNEVQAGESIGITVSMENKGEGNLYRVLGRSTSANPIFDGLEFPIGKMEPGKKVSSTVKVDVPRDSLDRQDEITIRFTEDNGAVFEDLVTWLTSWALPQPLFAYSYRVVIKGEEGKKDREVELLLSVKNIGEGDSRDSVVVLRAPGAKGLTLQNNRVELGELKVGEEKIARLGLTTGETAGLNLEVMITDLALGAQLSSTLVLPVDMKAQGLKGSRAQGLKGSKAQGSEGLEAQGLTGWVEGPDLPESDRAEWAYKGGGMAPEPPPSYRPPGITLKGGQLVAKAGIVKVSFLAEDDRSVEGAYVMVNNSKAFFKQNHARECTFTAELPISKGPNLVRIVAYDDQNLSTEKAFMITGR